MSFHYYGQKKAVEATTERILYDVTFSVLLYDITLSAAECRNAAFEKNRLSRVDGALLPKEKPKEKEYSRARGRKDLLIKYRRDKTRQLYSTFNPGPINPV